MLTQDEIDYLDARVGQDLIHTVYNFEKHFNLSRFDTNIKVSNWMDIGLSNKDIITKVINDSFEQGKRDIKFELSKMEWKK
jgi:hypothetical protein